MRISIRCWLMSAFLFSFAMVSGVMADFVDLSRAESMSKGWLNLVKSPLGAKMSGVIEGIDGYKDGAGVTAFYVVKLSPAGFIVVSADDYVQPVVAFSSNGKFIADPQNPLYDFVSMDIPKRIENVKMKQKAALDAKASFLPPKEMSDAKSKWNSLVSVCETGDGSKYGTTPTVDDPRVEPITSSTWNQAKVSSSDTLPCYNYYTPNNYVCGCVATAMAQLMRFNQHPSAGIGVNVRTISVGGVDQSASTRGGDGIGGAYDWTKMPLSPGAGITLAERQMIGSLCSDSGICVAMDYTSGSSGTDTLLAADAFTSVFKYSNAIAGYNSQNELVGHGFYEMANPNLDAGLPVLLGITGPDGGHAIVCDGYGYNLSVMYHHLNMGWSGQDNTWYDLPNIGTWANFNTVYKCIYNVFKSGTGEIISGRIVDSSGIPILGAEVTADDGAGGIFSDTTDKYGIYAFAKVKSATTYTVTYSGQTQQVTTGTSTAMSTTCGNKWAINFPGYSISGIISGGIQEGVTLTLSGTSSSTTLSGSGGAYTFSGLAAGNYTVTPSLSGYVFTPFSQNVTISNANLTGVDFTATAISILGEISKLSFNSSYKDSIKSYSIDGEKSYEQYCTNKFTVQATIQFPSDFDLTTIGVDTGFSFNFGLYLFNNTLGNAFPSKFNGEKGGSATFKITGEDAIKVKTVTIEKVDLRWDKNKKLTVRITGTPVSNSGTNVVNLSGTEVGPVEGTVDNFFLTFSNAGANFKLLESLAYTGKKSSKIVIKDKGKDTEQTFTLVNWSVRGKWY